MKAIIVTRYGSPDVLELREVEKPVPGDNEVLVKICAAVVSATDPVFRKGEPFIARFFTGLTRPKFATPGDALAGEIEAVGKNVTRFRVGDQVFGATTTTMGAHAQYKCLPEDGALVVKPSAMSFTEVVGVVDGALGALNFMRDAAKIQSGQNVLINGASGSVGTYGVQLAKYFGARVTGVCSTGNLQMVKSLGADKVIDYTQEDFTRNGETYDIILDAVGKSSVSRCRNSLTATGTYVTTVPAPDFFIQVLLTRNSKGKKARFVAPGLRSNADKVKDLTLLKGLIETGKLKSVIDRCYPLEEIAEAHRYVEKGHKKGNVVLTLA